MKNSRTILVVLALCTMHFAVSLQALSATYYCSPNGNGDGTSYASPSSLANGISRLTSPGDTLYLLGGQYDLGNTSIANKNGTAQKRIVIAGYPGEQAILDFRTTPYGTRGLQVKSTCTYLHIKNLTLRYSGKNNLYNEGSYCLFENLDIYGSADTGCQMKNGGNNVIKNVDSHDNFDYQNGTLTNADFGGNADGFADKQHSGAANHYIGCRAWNNSDDGWDFYQRVTASETIIEDCICYINGQAEYDMRNHPRYQTDKAWFDRVNGYTITNRYGQQQVVSMEHYPNHGNGNGFKMGGGYTNHLVLIHHCLSVGNMAKGFDQNNNDGTMRIYNNTGVLNKVNNFGFTTAYGTLYIQNNVSYQGSDATKSKTTKVNSYNTWNGGVSVSAADFISVDTTLLLAARNSDGSLNINGLFCLADGSDLIDAGTDVGISFMGTAPDLGWHETDGVIRPSVLITSGPEEQWVMAGDSIQPIVFTWSGTDNKPNNTKLNGITSKVSNGNKTITFTGAIATPGTYQISVTTTADSLNVTATATIHVRPDNLHRVAFVTTPDSPEDQPILSWLNTSDSISIAQVNANETTTDYSGYEAIVIGPKPSSSAAGFTALKGYNKPILVLKPFLFKSNVWNWGTPLNTQDIAITVSDTTHTVFQNLDWENGNRLTLFSACKTNAVTAMSDWTNTSGFSHLASPESQSQYTTIADFPPGTNCNGTVLPQRLLMIGLSEYSTANLTDNGLRLIENAICYLLGIAPAHRTTDSLESTLPYCTCRKIYENGQIIILRDGIRYSTLGQKLP